MLGAWRRGTPGAAEADWDNRSRVGWGDTETVGSCGTLWPVGAGKGTLAALPLCLGWGWQAHLRELAHGALSCGSAGKD